MGSDLALTHNVKRITFPYDYVYMIIKKNYTGPFIRGPIYLDQFKKFRNLGFGPTLVLLHYSWKLQMQMKQRQKVNERWPVVDDPTWVRMSNIEPFWRRPQQKYEALKKCLKADLIEVRPTKSHQAAIIKIKGLKGGTDGEKKKR